ncbi:MAG: glycosyltransferase [Pseudomonadota bacterium]
MIQKRLELGGEVVELTYPEVLQSDIDVYFGRVGAGKTKPSKFVRIEQAGDDTFELSASFHDKSNILKRSDLPAFVMEDVIEGLITDQSASLVLHAGAVAHKGKAVIIPGVTGAGKSVLTALLVEYGFDYLTDELVLVGNQAQPSIRTLPRSLTLRAESLTALPEDGLLHQMPYLEGSARCLFPLPTPEPQGTLEPGLLIFPQFIADSELAITPMTAAEAASRLLQGNLNARNLDGGGLAIASRLARKAPAIILNYGHSDQLEGVLDVLIGQVLASPMSAQQWRHYLSAFTPRNVYRQPTVQTTPAPKQELLSATPSRGKYKLTVGMATYDDFDGVYFSVQALRLQNADLMKDVEILVLDNNPTGVCAAPLKNLENDCPSYRYVPYAGHSGTSIRDLIFDEAAGEFVLTMDCHVLLLPGVLEKLLAYIDDNPTTSNLLQGPLISDKLEPAGTHFKPEWGSGMYGAWGMNESAHDPSAAPFEIEMQGLGLFVCRKDAWPYFNPNFRGFGGEEGYIHEKFRQRGDKTLCLPFLRWLHRFPRPMGVPYKPNWHDRIRNYTLALRELGLAENAMHEHFKELLGEKAATAIIDDIEAEFENPFTGFGVIRCISSEKEEERRERARHSFRSLGIEKWVNFLIPAEPDDDSRAWTVLAHRSAILDAQKRGLETVLVFDDQALPAEDAAKRLPGIFDQLQQVKWGIVSLHDSEAIEETEDEVLARTNGIENPRAIAYHSSVFEPLLETWPDSRDGMEKWLADEAQGNVFSGIDCAILTAKPGLMAEAET